MAGEIYSLIGVLVITAFSSFGEVSGIRCYTCTGVANLTECHTVTDCTSPDMKCYATKYYRESDGAYVHDLSCMAPTACSPGNKRDITVWQSCCDGEYCNKNLDDAGNPLDPQFHSRHCYHCRGVADPLDCLTTATCQANEACFTIEEIASGGKQVFNMNCLDANACVQVGHHLPFGKRTTMCRACCDTRENCNNQFCSKKLGITGEQPLGPSVEPITASTTPATTTTQYSYNAVITPSYYVGKLGGDADFNCTFQHNDPNLTKIRFVWTFSGTPSDIIYNNTVSDMSLVLTIHDLEHSDLGTYYCDIFYMGIKYSDSATLKLPTKK